MYKYNGPSDEPTNGYNLCLTRHGEARAFSIKVTPVGVEAFSWLDIEYVTQTYVTQTCLALKIQYITNPAFATIARNDDASLLPTAPLFFLGGGGGREYRICDTKPEIFIGLS